MRRWGKSQSALAQAAGQANLFSRRVDVSATSRAARDAVLASGAVSRQGKVVLQYLRARPQGATYREIAEAAIADGKIADRNAIARRLPELEKRGLVRRAGERQCAVTGSKLTLWVAL